MLCSDSGDEDNAQVGDVHVKSSRAIGQNIRLSILHAHMRTFHPDACRFGAKSLLSMGFTMRAVGDAVPPLEGLHGLRMTSVPLVNAPLPVGRAPRGVSVGSSALPPSLARHASLDVAFGRLPLAPLTAGVRGHSSF